MRYRVYSEYGGTSGAYKIYDSRLEKYPIFNTQLDLELNKTGAFVFEVYPTHPNFDKLHKMRSIVTIYQDDDLIFRGRVLNDEQGFYNQKQVICEGELAFLLDSVIRPYEFEGTPEEYFRMLINSHNEQVDEWKQFKIGVIDITDGDTSNDANQIQRSDTDYKTTWDLISEKLIESLGGYLWVRHEVENNKIVTYIDYLQNINILSNQPIKFGKNLLDIKKTISGEDVMTGIIPLGAKPDESDTRITIAEVNDGVDYLIDEEAAESLGRIFKTVVWDEVNDANILKQKAQAYLADAINFSGSIELTAADLSGIEDVNPFKLGRTIEIKDDRHGLEELAKETTDGTLRFVIQKISIDLLQPTNNKLIVGATFKTFTEITTGTAHNQTQVVERIEKIENHVAGHVTQQQMSSAVEQSSEQIMTKVSEDYFLKDDANTLIESTSTKFTQTHEAFEMKFDEFNQDVNELANETDTQFQEIRKYIRFEDGDIILGEAGNEISLRIENDRIAFLQHGAEVAYFNNRKLYVIDGEFLGKLKLGNYAFEPQEDGSLTFGLSE